MMTALSRFDAAFAVCPLIAILRGVQPEEVVAVASALFESGFRLIEVPLNSPSPFESIARLVEAFSDRAVIGAGTVTTPEQVTELARIGADMVISPHTDPAVVKATVQMGLVSLPGILSASEAFLALHCGAHALKLFPMEMIGAGGIKALKAILPKGTRLLGVGGIETANIPLLKQAGCAGFGIGSTLFRPGDDAAQVRQSAHAMIAAWQKPGQA